MKTTKETKAQLGHRRKNRYLLLLSLAWLILTVQQTVVNGQSEPSSSEPSTKPGKPGAIASEPGDGSQKFSAHLIIKLVPGKGAIDFSRAWGLSLKRTMLSDPDMHVFKAPTIAKARAIMTALQGQAAVVAAFYDYPSQNELTAFVPDDPYFNNGNPQGWPGQWHLVYGARPELDANVQGAWNRDITGAGVLIGICDDGVDTAHEDLSPGYTSADSYDFASNDRFPDPVRNGFGSQGDNHGTSVAGVSAARGGNGIGVSGAAPLASIAGIRLPFDGSGSISAFVDGVKYHSFGANKNIRVKNHSYGIGAPYIGNGAERFAAAESASAGTIHCYSAGNERGQLGQDSNKKDSQSSPDVICVAAMSSTGLFASYSCFGACVFVTAGSSSFREGEWGITTTDRRGEFGYNPGSRNSSYPDRDYAPDFGGTSSSSPLVAGVMALGVQANPAMDVRMAKHLLVKTSDVVDPNDSSDTSDGGWKTNAAGNKFNQNYGFGNIDADEFTMMATQFSGVTSLQTSTTGRQLVNTPIPNRGEISRSFEISQTTPVEDVLVKLEVTHTLRGDVEAFIVSPSGTSSRLCIRERLDLANNIDWTFLSNAFWGENPQGTWTITLRDNFLLDTGSWNAFEATVRMGELVASGGIAIPSVSSFTPSTGNPGTQISIAGSKFDRATGVSFGNTPAVTFSVDSATRILATVPTGAQTGPVRISNVAGTGSSAQIFTVTDEPSITSFSPTAGSAGTSVRIDGANLDAATSVRFNTSVASFTIVSPTELSAIVPAGATTGRISVMTPQGTATSSMNFTVTTEPVIAGFQPSTGGVGTSVTIEGSNFSATTAVRFNGVDATNFATVSASQITATVPGGATSGRITVITASGTTSSPTDFTLVGIPVITDFSPASAPFGASVVITGERFANATSVRFGSGLADLFSVNSDSQISAVVPASATAGKVQVTTASGTAISTADFSVRANPDNDGFSTPLVVVGEMGVSSGSNIAATKEPGELDHAGNAGGRSIWFQWQAPADGTWVFDTLGSSFDTTLAVYQGNALTSLTEIASNDDSGGDDSNQTYTSRLIFAAVAGSSYTIAVDGFNPTPSTPSSAESGGVILNWSRITQAPTITSFSPAQGAAGTVVQITGSGLIGASSVQFNGSAASFTVETATQLRATVPSGATSGLITITTPAGSVTSVSPFSVSSVASNDSFASAETIDGVTGTTAGSNNGTSKEPGEPAHAGTPGGASVWFSWIAPDAATYEFTTSGSDFDTLLAAYTGESLSELLVIGSNDDINSSNRASTIVFQATGGTTYQIAIDGWVGLGGNYNLSWQRVSTAPLLTSFTPNRGSRESIVVITGENFNAATGVSIGGASSAYSVNSNTQITATISKNATAGASIITVTSPDGTAQSNAAFTVTEAELNDNFASPVNLSGLAVIVAGSSTGAEKEPGEPNHAGNTGGSSVWFSWATPLNGQFVVETAGSDFDTILAVYSGANVNNLSLVASDDDSGPGSTSRVIINASSGVTYRIAVDGYGGVSGNVVLTISPSSVETSIYQTGFELSEGFQAGLPLAGQGSWEGQGSGGNGIVNEFFPGEGQQAFVGFNPPTPGEEVQFVWRAVNHTPDLATQPMVTCSVDMAIIDSTNFEYDDFEWVAFNSNVDRLFTLNFDNTNLSIFYQLDDGVFVDTGFGFENGTKYELIITMDFAENHWGATLDGVAIVEDKAITTQGSLLDLADVDAAWKIRNGAPGDNYLLLDNFSLVAKSDPAPSILSQPTSLSVEEGGAVFFGLVASGQGDLSYQWFKDGVTLPGANAAFFQLISAQPSDAGNYSVMVSNSAGSVTSSDVALTVSVQQADTFAAWIETEFLGETDPAIIGALADPESDGIANFVEFGLGLDPNVAETLPVRLFIQNDRLAFEVTRSVARPNIDYIIEAASDLVSPDWERLLLTIDTPGLLRAIDTRSAAQVKSRFFRLRVVGNE
ncbi:MAG: subtilisin-like proprotein convertase family protein [Pseudoalteromonas tetraodonis]|jgi:subtilisin-like proprotein convertase family protein